MTDKAGDKSTYPRGDGSVGSPARERREGEPGVQPGATVHKTATIDETATIETMEQPQTTTTTGWIVYDGDNPTGVGPSIHAAIGDRRRRTSELETRRCRLAPATAEEIRAVATKLGPGGLTAAEAAWCAGTMNAEPVYRRSVDATKRVLAAAEKLDGRHVDGRVRFDDGSRAGGRAAEQESRQREPDPTRTKGRDRPSSTSGGKHPLSGDPPYSSGVFLTPTGRGSTNAARHLKTPRTRGHATPPG